MKKELPANVSPRGVTAVDSTCRFGDGLEDESVISFLQMNVRAGELLFEDDFPTGGLGDRWEVSGGEWQARDGVLTGRFRGNGGGLIYSRAAFPGDIMLDFTGRMLSPCDNDLNFTFRADCWDYANNDAHIGYVGGLNGWWTKCAGLERYPGCDLRALCGFKAEPDRDYHIQTGIVDNLCFLAVDGEPILVLSDPDPIVAPDCARVGLGTYCSQIEFRRFRVYRAVKETVERSYTARF